jgi:hypothetical protein
VPAICCLRRQRAQNARGHHLPACAGKGDSCSAPPCAPRTLRRPRRDRLKAASAGRTACCWLVCCLLLCWRAKPDSLKRGSRREPNYFICPERIPQDRMFTIGNLLTRCRSGRPPPLSLQQAAASPAGPARQWMWPPPIAAAIARPAAAARRRPRAARPPAISPLRSPTHTWKELSRYLPRWELL